MPLSWQKRDLTADNGAGADIGPPGPLPRQLVGRASDALADLAWTPEAWGLRGFGFRIAPPVPAPTPPDPLARWLHKAIFKRRFTAAERIAIRAARDTDPIVNDFIDLLDSAELVFLDDADLAAGLGYLASLGLLTAGRPAEIVI